MVCWRCHPSRALTSLIINGDLTTYKATIKERNFWFYRLVEMANYAPVILVAGNHGAELEGDLYVFARAKGKHPIYLWTEPQFIELGHASVAVFPYPRKAEMSGNEQNLGEAFALQLGKFNCRFEQRPGMPQAVLCGISAWPVPGRAVVSRWSDGVRSIPSTRSEAWKPSMSGSATFTSGSNSLLASGTPGRSPVAITAKSKIKAITW